MRVGTVDQEIFGDGPLFVSRHQYGQEVTVVSLAGELDRSNVGSARRTIGEASDEEGDEILVVDLSSLEFIDSAGVALLFSLAKFGGDGSRLRLVPSEAPAVARVLKLTGVEQMLTIAKERPTHAA